MDSKNLTITILSLCIIIILGIGAYYFYTSLEQELGNTRSELAESEEVIHGLNLRLMEEQKNAVVMNAQLDDTKKNLDTIELINTRLSDQLTDVEDELNSLKRKFDDFLRPKPRPNWPILSPVFFDTSSSITKNEAVIAHGPSGEALNGISFNNPTWTVGIKGRALKFNGTNQYVSLGNIFQDSYTHFSVACWIKHPVTTSGAPAQSNWQNVVERGEWDNPDGIGLLTDYFGQSVDFGHYNNFVKSKAVVQDNQWHYVVGTMAPEGSNYIFSIYVDGKLDNTYTSSVGLDATTKPWAMGARYNGSWTYQGFIEDVRFYDRTLSAAEISKLYNQ